MTREYYLKNRDKILERQRKYTAKNKEKLKDKQKKYYEEHKKTILEQMKVYQKVYQKQTKIIKANPYDELYERAKKKFMKDYGDKHLCGNCKHTTECTRMKIQGLNKNLGITKKMLDEHSKFIKSYCVEFYTMHSSKKLHTFVKVYDCTNFDFEM